MHTSRIVYGTEQSIEAVVFHKALMGPLPWIAAWTPAATPLCQEPHQAIPGHVLGHSRYASSSWNSRRVYRATSTARPSTHS